MLLLEQLLDAADDLAVVDGVADLAAFRRVLAGQADLEIELYRLRHFLFPLVDADQRFDLEFADEDDVHLSTGEARRVRREAESKTFNPAVFG